MKTFSLSIAICVLLPVIAPAQDAPAPAPAEESKSGLSLPKFSLPFNIPGLTGGDEEEEVSEVAVADTSEVPDQLAPPTMPGAPPAMPGAAPGGPGNATMPPGVKPDPDGGLDFVQRSNFVISKIRNNFRQLDPFGMPMDPTNPSESPGIATQYEELEDVPVLTNSSLKNALSTIPISGIYPNKNVIVIGARSFSRGDQFGMKLEELTIRLRFEGVRHQKIYFKDLDTQEVASVDFNPKPKEFEPITSNTTAPQGEGIVPMDSLFIVN